MERPLGRLGGRHRFQYLASEYRAIFCRERGGWPVSAELHGLAQRIEKDFTIGAIPEVPANFSADVAGQLVVQIGRQPLKDFKTIPFAVILMRGRLSGAWICAYSGGHHVPSCSLYQTIGLRWEAAD